jgi:hypothetical protein
MTILPWPTKPQHQPRPTNRKMIIDPLPRPVLDMLVSAMPGRGKETKAERDARFQRQLAEVMAYQPRTALEAMLAIQCIAMRMMCEDASRDARRTDLPERLRGQNRNLERKTEAHIRDAEYRLAEMQKEPVHKFRRVLFDAAGVEPWMKPDPDDPENAEQADSAVIVPLHPSPETLQ